MGKRDAAGRALRASGQRLAHEVPVWVMVGAALGFDAGCGGRSGLSLFGAGRNDLGVAGRGGVGGAGGTGGSSAATGGSSSGTGGNVSGGTGGVFNDGGANSRGGVGGAAGQSGIGGVAGQSASGSAGSAGVAGTGGSAGTAGTAGTAGSEGGEGGAGGEPGYPPNATALALGAFHSCSAFDDGRLRCWGSPGYIGAGNELTIGDDETPSTIDPVDIGGNVVALAAGWYHTCVVLDHLTVRCFGVAGGGRLGYGNAEDIGDDEAPSAAGDVDLGGRATQLSAGPQHTCARLVNGKVRCWGQNSGFQLGYPDPTTIGDDESPSAAGDVDVGGRVEQVVVGYSHTCALLRGGTVRCWGEGSGGRLGYGNNETIGDDETPASAGDVDVGGEVVSLAAGFVHTCALLSNGAVRCWGQATDGALGYGNFNAIGDDETPASAGDVDVGGPVMQLAAGDFATCALLVGGSVRCWGRAEQGELGYGGRFTGDIGDDETPASVGDLELGGPATSIDVGFLHACATMATGAVRCWGRGETSALGYGNVEDIGDDETPASAGDVKLWP